MDFAKRELSKYGWKEGDGLGKNSCGIKEPLKVKIKKDVIGFGYKQKNSFNWWEYGFNKAASNLSVHNSKDNDPTIETKGTLEISTSRPKKRRKNEDIIHNGFCKATDDVSELKEDEETPFNKYLITLSDEQLFQVCGKRTAHKGARHGLKSSGKLARLAKQESNLK